MAESIYTQLANQTILTPVNGVDIRHELPEGLFPDDKTFENESALIAWAKENNCTAELIQKGLQKAIIEVRAVFKACKKDETWDEDLGNTNVNAMEWTMVDRPNQTGAKSVDKARFADCMNMIAKLTAAGMDKETIEEMTSSIYGEEVVQAIINTVTE